MSPYSEGPHIATAVQPCEYSQEERELLLRLAHRSIALALEGRAIDPTSPMAHLAEPRGAFVTLHLEGELRGCTGYVRPAQPLYPTVGGAAGAAALDDPCFPPVTPVE